MQAYYQHREGRRGQVASGGAWRVRGLWLLLVLSCCVAVAQTSPQPRWRWPIVGVEPGSGILFKPQDYIGQEFNYYYLFVSAPEGATVVAPASGVVQHISLNYQQSLTSAVTYAYKGDFDGFVKQNEAEITQRLGPVRYLSGSLTIKIPDGRKLTLWGLRLSRRFSTGERIQAGDTIGLVHYTYSQVPQPSICISVSNAQGRPADPMADFGLKTSFRPAKAVVPKAVLTRAEATADLRQLTSAIRELYPSLTDLMSYEDYDRWVDSLAASLPQSISRGAFGSLLSKFNRRIHDSHLYIDLGGGPKVPQLPEILFGQLGDKVLAYMATDKYQRFVGQEIAAIGGKPVGEITERYLDEISHLYDMSVASHVARRLALHYAFADAVLATRKGAQSPLSLTFASGENVQVGLLDQKRAGNPYGKALLSYLRVSQANRHKAGYKLEELNDTTAYVGLSTFALSQVDTQAVVDFIRQMERKGKPALIIDLRNNPGGDVECLYPILSEVLPREQQKRSAGYSVVNATSFKTPMLNYISGTPIFEDYRPVEGKPGLYLYHGMPEQGATTDSLATKSAYTGRLYVIIDSGSASASTEFAGNIKHSGRGVIFGRETSSSYHFFTAIKFASIQLQHSRYGVSIPLVRCVFDEEVNDKFPAGRGVLPDVELPISLEELRSEGDYILARVQERIVADFAQGL